MNLISQTRKALKLKAWHVHERNWNIECQKGFQFSPCRLPSLIKARKRIWRDLLWQFLFLDNFLIRFYPSRQANWKLNIQKNFSFSLALLDIDIHHLIEAAAAVIATAAKNHKPNFAFKDVKSIWNVYLEVQRVHARERLKRKTVFLFNFMYFLIM